MTLTFSSGYFIGNEPAFVISIIPLEDLFQKGFNFPLQSDDRIENIRGIECFVREYSSGVIYEDVKEAVRRHAYLAFRADPNRQVTLKKPVAFPVLQNNG